MWGAPWAPLSPQMMAFGLSVLDVLDCDMWDKSLCWPIPVAVALAAEGRSSCLQGHPRYFSGGKRFSNTHGMLGTQVGARKELDILYLLNIGACRRCL